MSFLLLRGSSDSGDPGGVAQTQGPTSLLICYPDIPKSALVVSSVFTYDDDYPFESTFYGERSAYGKLAANSTYTQLQYDLGSLESRTVDHFILGEVGSLVANGITEAVLYGSNDASNWTQLLGTTTGFLTRDFDGPEAKDVIFTEDYNSTISPPSTSYRYFRVVIAGAASHTVAVSKIYFGSAFDMGKEPDFYSVELLTEQDADTWRNPGGHILLTKAYKPKLRFTFEWDGVTDEKTEEFFEKILSDPYRDTVFLYAATYEDPLYDHKLVHCRVVADACSATKRNDGEDWWDVTAVFEEA